MIVHLYATRTTGQLASEELVDKLRGKLSLLENDYYSVMCQLKIALRAKGSDLPVFKQTPLTQLFAQMGNSYTHELYRVYILLNDSTKASNYLSYMLSAILRDLNNSNA